MQRFQISLNKYLKSKSYDCTFEELKDAIDSLHLKCQTLEQSQYLLHKAELLKFIFQKSSTVPSSCNR